MKAGYMLTLGELRKAIGDLPDSTPFYVLGDRFVVLLGESGFFAPINYAIKPPPFAFNEMKIEAVKRHSNWNTKFLWSQKEFAYIVKL